MSFGKRKDGRFYNKTQSSSISKAGTVQPSGIALKPKKNETYLEKIGINIDRINRGWNNGSKGTSKQRQIGNKLIEKIIKSSKEQYPKYSDYSVNSTSVFNEYNTIQRTFAQSEKIIEQLLKWQNDGNPKTWKWTSPIALTNGNDFAIFDDQNNGWISDAYKGKVAITLMSPEDFLKLASPNTLIIGRHDIRGDSYTTKITDKLTKRMLNGQPVDTTYLMVDENFRVYSHEGQHRALSAIKAGIKEMPVYVYTSNQLTDNQLTEISLRPQIYLKPKSVRP